MARIRFQFSNVENLPQYLCTLHKSPIRILLASAFAFASTLFALPDRLGDLDEDGLATVFDLTRLIAHINNSNELSPTAQIYADIDQDGDIDQVDVQLLRDAVLLRFDLPEPEFTYTLFSTPESVADQNFTISGASLPGVTILVEGALTPQTGSVNADGSFNVQITLKENQPNRIYVTIFDEEGNASPPRALHIIHDTKAPNIFIDFPGNNSEVYTETTDIAGRVGDLLSGYRGLDVTVNGDSAEVIVGIGQNGTFERSGIPLEVGKNTVTVAATDALGNTITKTSTIYRRVPVGPLIEVVSGNNQASFVNDILSEAATVRIRYPNGTPIVNKLVTFKVIKSNGMLAPTDGLESFIGASLSYQATTDAQGLARVYWRMGHDAGCGNNRLQATSKDVAGISYFCASTFAEPPSQINIGSGNNQRGSTGSFAVEPLRVWVNDSCNGAEDVAVTFRVVAGDGKVDGQNETTVMTTRTGHAGIEFKLGTSQGNNIIEADFEGNPGPPATFVVYGLASKAGASTTWEGIVLDNASNPVGGVHCQLEVGGVFQPAVLSDENGVFRMDNLPAGAGYLHIDGLVANTLNGEEIPLASFPALHYEVLVIENAANSLGEAALLPSLDPDNAHSFDNSQDLVLTTVGMEGLKMTIKAGSMRLADGTKPDWRNPATVSLNQVHHDDAPMPMPDGVSPPFAWTLQPSGATFDPPVQIEYPNMKGLAPGAVAYFLSYDHDLEEFVIVASGHVTDDGSTILTDEGVGIEKAGWGCNCPPYSVTTDCKNCEYECKEKGTLTGGTVTPTKELVCEGNTLSFTASGVKHEGGQLIEKCPETEDKVIDVTAIPTYEWTITSPALASPLTGTGPTATVSNAKVGKYTCVFKAKVIVPSTATVDCVPTPITLPSAEASVYKIELVTPKGDPVAAPDDSGDGQNEFTFSNAADGILTINFKAKVTPTGTDLSKVKDSVKFTMQNVGSAVVWNAANPGGKASVSGNFLVATATVTKLPASNSAFGKKKAALYCDNVKKEESIVEIFFPKAAKNHTGTGAGTTPNWFYYWAGTAVPGYDLTSGTYVYANGGASDYAQYNGNSANPTYSIHGPASAGHEMYTSAGLAIDRKGIDTLAATLVHEKTHRQVDLNNLPGGIWHGKADQDLDELPDEIEDAMAAQGFDKTMKVTWSTFPYGDDEEVYCEIQAKTTTGVAAKDWANPGKNSKTKF